MGKISLRSGAWTGAVGLLFGGAVEVIGAEETQGVLRYLGWAAIILGLAVLLWGVTIDGRPWWKRNAKAKRQAVSPITLDDAFRYIANESMFGASLDHQDPSFTVRVSNAMQSALESGDLPARGHKYHVLKGGIKDPPLHPRTKIDPLFWSRHHASSYWAINNLQQSIAGSQAFSAVPPNSAIEGDDQYVGYHDICVDRERMKLIWPSK